MPEDALQSAIAVVKGTCYLLVFFVALFLHAAWENRGYPIGMWVSIALAGGACVHLLLQIRTLRDAVRAHGKRVGGNSDA